ncbi:MAG: hydantoinase/oxoprolinase family protein [Roseococcus sp.]|nr:hydantoinase/oxoprolinase family protein [Roseococcus sp.]
MSGGWRVGVDMGGTFTDVLALHPREAPRTAKTPTRPDDPVAGIMAALAAVGLAPEEVEELAHGTTRITNALVEGRLAPVALIATAGFEDIVEIGRQSRRDLYRLAVPPKPPAPVPRERRIALPGRLAHDGTELAPLPEGAAEAAAEAALATGAEAIAVCLLHAYANPAHEQAVAARLAGRARHLALSHRINPEAREYERTLTTVLSAAVMPLAADYLAGLRAGLPPATRLSVMHSAGGLARPEEAAARPLVMALSGPAAGVAAAAAVARSLGEPALLTFDMGGTTTDVALVLEGRPEVTADARLADHPLRQPMVAIDSIGAGGGSLVRLGAAGLSIGPQSAGAEPGPACYGRGGREPTVCDAHAALGYLNPRRRLGGSIALDPEAARAALAPLAARLGVDPVAAALGVLRVADATMARALNRVTVERGVDGRGAALLAYGGMGPMHAAGLARAYGLARVIVPAASSAFSALGCVAAETSAIRQRTLRLDAAGFDAEGFAAARAALAAEAAAALPPGSAAPRIEEVALMRYRGQSQALEAPLPPGRCDGAALAAALRARHLAVFGFALGEAWEVLGLRATARQPRSPPPPPPAAALGPPEPFAVDPCWFAPGPPTPTPRYARAALAPPHRVAGPAVIEDEWSTILVPPGWAATPDAHGHLRLEPGA